LLLCIVDVRQECALVLHRSRTDDVGVVAAERFWGVVASVNGI
jgi:hypothetical protein